MDPLENGERYRTKILEVLVESEEQLAKHPDRIKFVCSVNDDMYEEILTYNEILEYIAKKEEQDADQAIVWKFKHIAGHQGPLKIKGHSQIQWIQVQCPCRMGDWGVNVRTT